MATHGSNADVIGNGYLLSPYFSSATRSGQRDSAEATTFKNLDGTQRTTKAYIPGLKDTTMNFEGVYDGAVDAVDDVLWAAMGAGTGIFTYSPRGHQTFLNEAYTLDVVETSYEINTDVGDVAQISAEFSMGDTGIIDRGYVFHPMATEGALGNTASRDNTVVTTTGAALTVHALSSTTLTVFLQDSADNSTFADLTGSLLFTTGRGSKRLAIPGTIRRYTRVRWTGTGQFLAVAARL